MKSIKIILLILVITGVAMAFIVWAAVSLGFNSLVFAFLLNWLVLSWATIICQVVPISFPSRYYSIKAFEQSGKTYEQLGIRSYKKMVLSGARVKQNQKRTLSLDKSSAALLNMASKMQKAETYHVIVFLLIALTAFYALLRGYFSAFAWLLIFNIVINGYPIMLHRYNRNRVLQLVKK